MMQTFVVVIPALNEEDSIGKVIEAIPDRFSDRIVVVDNGSDDGTATVALKCGAEVLHEDRKGYGYACTLAINFLKDSDPVPDVLVFLDADYSDYPEEMPAVVDPILKQNYDLVIGSRVLGDNSPGSMTIPQRFGNWLSTRLIKFFWGGDFTDLGPFRAIKFERLLQLNMLEMTYGWTVEMQLKAVKFGLTYTEVPVSYRQRIGFSKVSGTIKGSVMAGIRILWTIFKNI